MEFSFSFILLMVNAAFTFIIFVSFFSLRSFLNFLSCFWIKLLFDSLENKRHIFFNLNLLFKLFVELLHLRFIELRSLLSFNFFEVLKKLQVLLLNSRKLFAEFIVIVHHLEKGLSNMLVHCLDEAFLSVYVITFCNVFFTHC